MTVTIFDVLVLLNQDLHADLIINRCQRCALGALGFTNYRNIAVTRNKQNQGNQNPSTEFIQQTGISEDLTTRVLSNSTFEQC